MAVVRIIYRKAQEIPGIYDIAFLGLPYDLFLQRNFYPYALLGFGDILGIVGIRQVAEGGGYHIFGPEFIIPGGSIQLKIRFKAVPGLVYVIHESCHKPYFIAKGVAYALQVLVDIMPVKGLSG